MGALLLFAGSYKNGDAPAFKLSIMAVSLFVFLFFLYKSLIWLAYAEGGWDGGPS
jgi:hypothetical protein